MELGGLLEAPRLFEFAEAASDVTERSVGRKRLRVESILGFFRGGRSLLIFFGFEFGAIFRRENLSALQVFFGVDVLGFFLLGFFARAFLLGGVGNILSAAFPAEEKDASEKENAREAQT
jgi:hypothetical protein